jgi:hypothetical protein
MSVPISVAGVSDDGDERQLPRADLSFDEPHHFLRFLARHSLGLGHDRLLNSRPRPRSRTSRRRCARSGTRRCERRPLRVRTEGETVAHRIQPDPVGSRMGAEVDPATVVGGVPVHVVDAQVAAQVT